MYPNSWVLYSGHKGPRGDLAKYAQRPVGSTNLAPGCEVMPEKEWQPLVPKYMYLGSTTSISRNKVDAIHFRY